jgi:CRISPR/Cas system CMR-associated protein Cmr1 (group 7 of RAMP superfamily)
MYKLEFTLKQHTPLIHFQHDQAGATLRATEVKPKLDQFLRKTLKQIRPDVYNEFSDLIALLPDSHKEENTPSPYKLVIQPVSEDAVDKYVIASFIPRQNLEKYAQQYKILDRTPYFADNKPLKDNKPQDAKLGLMLKDGEELKLVFRFLNPKWKKLLNKVLPAFFVYTNFGSRQSKGFGCFLPSNISQRDMENLLRICFPIVFRSKQFRDLKEVFLGIDSIYKNLKSGDRNTESELRKYFNDFRPVIEWEKPKIQEKVAEISKMNLRINSKTSNRQFVRAVLGLPEIFEYPKHGGIKAQVKFDKSQVKNDYEVIDRYGSPILFKVFDKTVYLTGVVNEFSKEIFNKTFDFEFIHQGRKYGDLFSLKTPEQFDLVKFIEVSMLKQINWKQID